MSSLFSVPCLLSVGLLPSSRRFWHGAERDDVGLQL